MAILPQDWTRTALEITGYFEGSADPWGAVSGNFDGMGVSLGVQQVNFGMHSLQPLARMAGQAAVRETMPTIGAEFWQACNAAGDGWKPIVARWHDGSRLRAIPRAELHAFAGCEAFVAQQVAHAGESAEAAWAAAQKWAAGDATFAGRASKALFCWFFDLVTQNGGLKGLTISDVRGFAASNPRPRDMIGDWLAARPASMSGAADARANAGSWRAPMPAERESLLILSYLRALKSNAAWQADVLNRKGSLAVWSGRAHGKDHVFDALFA